MMVKNPNQNRTDQSETAIQTVARKEKGRRI
jgi:hypothetical protein